MKFLFRRLCIFVCILLGSVSIADISLADTDTVQHYIGQSISPGSSEAWTHMASIADYGVLTGVQVQVENYIAYGEYDDAVSITLQKGGISRTVIAAGTLPDSQTVAPAGDTGTYTTSELNYWDGLPVDGEYQLTLNVASSCPGSPYFDVVNLILTYDVVYPDIVIEKNYMVSIANVSQELTSPQVGDEVYFNADFRIDDADLQSSFYIRCYLDNVLFHSQEYVALSEDTRIYYTTQSANKSWTVTPGSHTVRWEIDANDEIPESNESNNDSSRTWVVEDLFDFDANATTLVMPDGTPTNAYIGQTVYLKFDFDVDGSGTSPSFDVRCSIDGAEIWTSQNLTRTGGASYSLYTSNGWTVESGSHTASCELDYNQEVTESNESNNIATTGFTSEYNVAPTVSVTPTSGPQGTTFSQPGSDFTPDGTVTLHFTTPDGVSTDSETANSAGSYSHSWTCDNCPVGTYEYYAIDDTTSTQSNTVTFEVTASAEANTPILVPLYRLYKSNYPSTDFKDHFYTINWAERVSAEEVLGYVYERIEGYISKRPFDGGIPIYRLKNPVDSSHFYTTDEQERDTKLASGYQLEGGQISGVFGVEGYVYANHEEGLLPIYRLRQLQDAINHHFLTIRQNEYVHAISTLGFGEPALQGFMSEDGLQKPLAHRRPQANFGGADLGSGAYRGLNNLDLSMRGKGPDLTFSHHYNSFGVNDYPMGSGWSNSLDIYLEEIPRPECSANESDVYVHWGNGGGAYFETACDNSGDYIDKTGNHAVLTFFSDGSNYGYNLLQKDQTVYQFRRLTLNPPSELISFCIDEPGSFVCNREKIVLTKVQDWASNGLDFVYEASEGLLQEVRDNFGRSLELSYSLPPYRLQTVTERVGTDAKRSVSFAYNADGLLHTFTDAEGQSTTYAYYDMPDTAKHQLLQSMRYPKGNTVEIDYDQATGQAVSIKDSTSTNPGRITYQPETYETQVTDPENNVFQYVHSNGLLTQFKGQNDASWTTIERTDTDNPNLPTKVTDKRGNSTEYDYDLRGNLLWIKNADNMEANFTYKATNKLESSVVFHDPNQAVPPATVYTYDQNDNRLRTITNPEGETVSLGYHATNIDLVEAITDARGPAYKTDFTYDSYGNLETVTDAESNLTEYQNDYAGRTTAVTDAKGIKTTHTYDNNDHPLALANYRQDGINILRTINRLYDDNGNLEFVRWSNQGTLSQTQYTYDDRDRLETVVKPGGLTQTLTYYDNDLLHTRQDYNSQTTTYVYDDRNRLHETQYPDGSKVIISRNENGQPTNVTLDKTSGTDLMSVFNYDELNRMESHTDPYGKTVLYTYDEAGRLERLTYPGGNYVDYTYDAAGRMKTVTDLNNNGVVTYDYDAAGNLTEIQRSVNGTPTIKTVYTYDMASRLTGIEEKDATDAILWSYTYDLDEVGNHNSVDAVNEPLTFTPVAQNVTYSNDRINNRLLSAGSTTYTYDNNGNRSTSVTSGVTTTYSWDDENRLTGVSTPSGTSVQHVYDGMGNRIARIEDGVETRYVLDLNGDMSRVLAETDNAGNVTAYYVYGHGLLSRIELAGDRNFYHFNNRGDTVALSNDSGTITDGYAFDEYGKLMSSTGTTDNPFKFVGRFGVMDEGDDDYFMRARFYDAGVGGFLSEDPLGFGGGDWNLNNYSLNNPIILIDPSGLDYTKGGLTIGFGPSFSINFEGNAQGERNISFGFGLGFGFAGEVGVCAGDISEKYGWESLRIESGGGLSSGIVNGGVSNTYGSDGFNTDVKAGIGGISSTVDLTKGSSNPCFMLGAGGSYEVESRITVRAHEQSLLGMAKHFFLGSPVR